MTKICTFPVQILFDRALALKKAVSVGKTSPWAEKTLRPNKLDRHAAREGRAARAAIFHRARTPSGHRFVLSIHEKEKTPTDDGLGYSLREILDPNMFLV